VDTRPAIFAKLAAGCCRRRPLGARGPERVDGLREHLAGLGPERDVRLDRQLSATRSGTSAGEAVERNAIACEDERRHAEPFAFEARRPRAESRRAHAARMRRVRRARIERVSPAITSSAMAASVAVRAMGPVLSSSQSSGAMPRC
jgi:hypothetical protein